MSDSVYYAFALGAAACWAVGPFIAYGASRKLGAFAFNHLRMLSLAFIAGIVILGRDQLTSHVTFALPWGDILLLGLSGVIGIFIGDTCLFAALRRLGPRRNAIIFSAHAPMTFLLALAVFGETPSFYEFFGVGLVFVGVILAIFYGQSRTGKPLSYYETTIGGLTIAVVFGLFAALGQAVGALIAHPVMQAGADPIDAAGLRIGAAAFCYLILGFFPLAVTRAQASITRDDVVRTVSSGILGMGLGTTFLLIGLRASNAGVAATLMSLSPVLILPLLWIISRQPPTLFSWVGAACAAIGSALLFG